MPKKIDELLELIDKVETNEKKKISVAINKLKGKIKEDSQQPDTVQTKDYVTKLTTQALEKGTLPNYTDEELVRTKKSTQHKNMIREIVQQFDVVAEIDNPALSLAWNRVKKSNSVMELRYNLEMYITIKNNKYQEDVQEYVDMIDDLDKQVQQLKEYKRIQEELFSIIREDDPELKLLSEIEHSKKNLNLNDVQACKMFSCDRNKLNYLRRKFDLSVI